MIIRNVAAALLVFSVAQTAAAQAGHRVEAEFQSEAGTRRYVVWVPRGYDERGRMPLVVVLHGCLQSAADIERGTRFDERADRDGFLVLYPEQPATIIPTRCWRWFDPSHQGRDPGGEPTLLAALTRKVAQDYHADSRRVYVTGISAGGAMAVNLVAAYPDLFAAAAAHSALPYRAASGVPQAFAMMRGGVSDDSLLPDRVLTASGARREPQPLLVLHGGKDQAVVPRNGDQLATQWMLAVQSWLGHPLAITTTDTAVGGLAAHRVSYDDSNTIWVEHWTILELGHAWSGGSSDGTYTNTAGPRATDLIADFFGLGRAQR